MSRVFYVNDKEIRQRKRPNLSLTLAPAPTQPYSTSANRKALHTFNSALRVRLAHELDKTAVLAKWDFDLRAADSREALVEYVN